MINTAEREARKYAAIWEHPDYANFSPGEQFVDLFLELVGNVRGPLVDLGCGSGKASVLLRDAGFDVLCFDLVDARLDKSIRFEQGSIWSPPRQVAYEFGYCTDVMEHIPTEYVMLTLERIRQRSHRCFFSICNTPDHFGQRIGEPLHLTVKPFLWWKQRILESGGKIVHARDLLIDSVFWVDYG